MIERPDFDKPKDQQPDNLTPKNAGDLYDPIKTIDTYFNEKRRLEKRIAFRLIGKKKRQKQEELQRKLAEARQDTRSLFLLDAKELLTLAARRNLSEFVDLEASNITGWEYKFKHYLIYSLPSEGAATAGDENVGAITIKLLAPEDSQNSGEEMEIRFPTAEGIILDDLTTEEDVQAWIESINEIYILCHHQTKSGEHDVETYMLSDKIFRSYPGLPIRPEDIDKLKDQSARRDADEMEASTLSTIYKKLQGMKKNLVPFELDGVEA